MSTTQTPPPAAAPRHATLPALSPLARAVFADWDNPAISELQLAERHALTLEALDHLAQTPAFQAALAQRRRLRQQRLESFLQSAQDHAAQVFIHLSSRPPDSTTAAKEIRLALKDLLRLRGGPPDAQTAIPRGADLQSAIPRGADLQSASLPQPEPPETPPSTLQPADSPSRTLRARQDPDPTPAHPPSGGVGAAPTPHQHQPNLPDLPEPPSHPEPARRPLPTNPRTTASTPAAAKPAPNPKAADRTHGAPARSGAPLRAPSSRPTLHRNAGPPTHTTPPPKQGGPKAPPDPAMRG